LYNEYSEAIVYIHACTTNILRPLFISMLVQRIFSDHCLCPCLYNEYSQAIVYIHACTTNILRPFFISMLAQRIFSGHCLYPCLHNEYSQTIVYIHACTTLIFKPYFCLSGEKSSKSSRTRRPYQRPGLDKWVWFEKCWSRKTEIYSSITRTCTFRGLFLNLQGHAWYL